MTKNMKILITGSSGYVGNVLATYFAERGHQVIGADLCMMKSQEQLPNFKFYDMDVTNKNHVSMILEYEQPTHVIHLAYLMNPQHDVRIEYNVDVNGSKHVFDVCNSLPCVKQLLLFSSTSAYGGHPNNPVPIDENHELNPLDYVYGRGKRRVEEYYTTAKRRNNFNVPIVRMCTAVGPSYYKKGGVVSTFSKAPIAMALDGRDTKLQWLHEDDLTALVDLIIHDQTVDDVFNLVPEDHTTIKTMAKAHKKKVLWVPSILFKGIISLLWYLRLSTTSPPMCRLVKYGIVGSAEKLKARYNYIFKYTSLEAFNDAIEKRKANGTL